MQKVYSNVLCDRNDDLFLLHESLNGVAKTE